jgi:hypothetical protein
MKTTTFSLTDITEAFSWPKTWTNENVSTLSAFSLYALTAPTSGKTVHFVAWQAYKNP